MSNAAADQPRGPKEPNHLADETSPYLQQHAYNPVDWYPWGPSAFEEARRLDRPLFLSIGYSACHWCHVMEHESFENASIAELMNRWFINIKVDREERPDLDQIYMSSVTALTGRGGWPMSVFLTPELKPFYGGTYWPPESRMGLPGFRDVLERVHEAWVERRDDVEQGAESLTEAVIQMGQNRAPATNLDVSLLKIAVETRLRSADRVHGGLGDAPKFPHPMDLRLLFRLWRRLSNDDALAVARLTLDKMATGGIYDHLGGGFHRYSTDARWLVPHFEKMLYDNALLTPAYVEAYQATGDPDYARVVRETLDYVLREMTHPEGGFYSTQDADSEGEEGKYYVWTEEEIRGLLSEDARLFNYCYDVSASGNWEGNNILNRPKPTAQAARVLGIAEAELATTLERCRQTLLKHRAGRVPPQRDDKIIVAWNGLMLSAMAQGAMALDEPRFAEAAQRCADFLLARLFQADGRLLRVFKDGRSTHNGYLDDYACLVDGLNDVYQATFEPRYLDAAVALADSMIARFGDENEGGFFYTTHDHERLIARNKDLHDNATPSGNGMAAFALARLARLTGRTDLDEQARRTLEMLSGEMKRVSMAEGQALLALDDLLGPSYELVVVEGNSPAEAQDVLRSLHSRFLPNKVVAYRARGMADEALPQSLRPILADKSRRDDRTTLYVCERGACRQPAVGAEEINKSLAGL